MAPFLLYYLLLSILLIYLCNTLTINYRIKPDDPGGPYIVSNHAINDTFIFELEKYDSGHKYQVILSYPGYLPIFCNTSIETIDKTKQKRQHSSKYDNYNRYDHVHGHRRHLLDTSTNIITAPFLIDTQVLITVKCYAIDQQLFDEMRLRKLGTYKITDNTEQ